MSSARRLFGTALFLLCACTVRSPVREAVTLELTHGRDVASVVVTTEIDSGAGANSREKEARLEEVRRDITGARDAWALRFASVEKARDRVVFENRRGTLVHAERSATIARRDLQRMFGDTGLTFQFDRGADWTELSIYANASGRASREQRERVLSLLSRWSGDVAAYFRAMHIVYEYLGRQPGRELPVFNALLEDDDSGLREGERELVERVRATTDSLLKLMEGADQRGVSLDEQFDLVFNPFPAQFSVRTPRILEFEGFTKKGETLFAERAGLLDAVIALENRWLSPDPMAMVVRTDKEDKEMPAVAEIAAMPRQSSATVTAQEINSAVLEMLQRGGTYRVRFVER